MNPIGKKKSFSDDVMDSLGDGPGQGDEYSVDMKDEDEDDGDDENAQGDRVMAVKQLGKALGIEVSDPEKAAEALKTFIDSCY